jgi:hypothetical protein
MNRIDGDVEVQRFGFVSDEAGRRLVFPQAHIQRLEGRAQATTYGARDAAFELLEGRWAPLRWEAGSASVGGAWLRDAAGRLEVAIERAELPRGVRLARADRGIELLSPHVSFTEVRLTLRGPFMQRREPEAPPATGLRQERLRFLESLSGRIYLTLKVALDLPVLGVRSLDQQLRVPIQEGSLDYRALVNGLNWLEGAFVDVEHERDRLAVRWKVPIFGPSHDLISWPLDVDASTLASFGRVPVRSLADYRLATQAPRPDERKRKILRAFAVDAIDIALSLLAPRQLEIGGGTILFGGEDQPGMVDLKVTGAIRDKGSGSLRGAIGTVDTTIKDLAFGDVKLTADRLHFDGLDQLEVEFDGFSLVAVTMVVHRITATNLAIQIG